MKRSTILPISFMLCIFSHTAFAQENVVEDSIPLNPIATAAATWIASLSPSEKDQALVPFNSDKRTTWINDQETGGIPIQKLAESSKQQLLDLLTQVLSEQGLNAISALIGNSENSTYAIKVFGQPNMTESWGWQIRGADLLLNFNLLGDELIATPCYLGGINPKDKNSPSTAIYRDIYDKAASLRSSLNDAQLEMAITSEDFNQSSAQIDNPNVDFEAINGLPALEMDEDQWIQLEELIFASIQLFDQKIQNDHFSKMSAGAFDYIYFSWEGSYRPNKPFLFSLKGTGFIMEFEMNETFRMAWRDLDNDYGRALTAGN